MKYLLTAAVLAITATASYADPREGTKACIVDNARAFDPYTGTSALWDTQKNFILNVYSCSDVRRLGIDLGYSDACPGDYPWRLAIKTTIRQWMTGWDGAPYALSDNEQITPLTAEFRSSLSHVDTGHSPIFRLYLDQRFEFLLMSRADKTDNMVIFTMTGTCADFQ